MIPTTEMARVGRYFAMAANRLRLLFSSHGLRGGGYVANCLIRIWWLEKVCQLESVSIGRPKK